MRPVDQLPYLEWTTEAGETKRLYADVWKQEEISLPAVVTQHAVETGAKITDHYRKDPRTQRVELYFSDAPIRSDLDVDFEGKVEQQPLSYPEFPAPQGLRAVTLAVQGAVGSVLGIGPSGQSLPPSVPVLRFASPPANRYKRALQLVDELQTRGTLVTVGGSMLRLESMAIVEARGMRSAESGGGGTLGLELTQLTFTSSDVAVAIPLPVEVRAQPKKNANAGDPSKVEGPKSSALKSLTNSAGITSAGSGI